MGCDGLTLTSQGLSTLNPPWNREMIINSHFLSNWMYTVRSQTVNDYKNNYLHVNDDISVVTWSTTENEQNRQSMLSRSCVPPGNLLLRILTLAACGQRARPKILTERKPWPQSHYSKLFIELKCEKQNQDSKLYCSAIICDLAGKSFTDTEKGAL